MPATVPASGPRRPAPPGRRGTTRKPDAGALNDLINLSDYPAPSATSASASDATSSTAARPDDAVQAEGVGGGNGSDADDSKQQRAQRDTEDGVVDSGKALKADAQPQVSTGADTSLFTPAEPQQRDHEHSQPTVKGTTDQISAQVEGVEGADVGAGENGVQAQVTTGADGTTMLYVEGEGWVRAFLGDDGQYYYADDEVGPPEPSDEMPVQAGAEGDGVRGDELSHAGTALHVGNGVGEGSHGASPIIQQQQRQEEEEKELLAAQVCAREEAAERTRQQAQLEKEEEERRTTEEEEQQQRLATEREADVRRLREEEDRRKAEAARLAERDAEAQRLREEEERRAAEAAIRAEREAEARRLRQEEERRAAVAARKAELQAQEEAERRRVAALEEQLRREREWEDQMAAYETGFQSPPAPTPAVPVHPPPSMPTHVAGGPATFPHSTHAPPPAQQQTQGSLFSGAPGIPSSYAAPSSYAVDGQAYASHGAQQRQYAEQDGHGRAPYAVHTTEHRNGHPSLAAAVAGLRIDDKCEQTAHAAPPVVVVAQSVEAVEVLVADKPKLGFSLFGDNASPGGPSPASNPFSGDEWAADHGASLFGAGTHASTNTSYTSPASILLGYRPQDEEEEEDPNAIKPYDINSGEPPLPIPPKEPQRPQPHQQRQQTQPHSTMAYLPRPAPSLTAPPRASTSSLFGPIDGNNDLAADTPQSVLFTSTTYQETFVATTTMQPRGPVPPPPVKAAVAAVAGASSVFAPVRADGRVVADAVLQQQQQQQQVFVAEQAFGGQQPAPQQRMPVTHQQQQPPSTQRFPSQQQQQQQQQPQPRSQAKGMAGSTSVPTGADGRSSSSSRQTDDFYQRSQRLFAKRDEPRVVRRPAPSVPVVTPTPPPTDPPAQTRRPYERYVAGAYGPVASGPQRGSREADVFTDGDPRTRSSSDGAVWGSQGPLASYYGTPQDATDPSSTRSTRQPYRSSQSYGGERPTDAGDGRGGGVAGGGGLGYTPITQQSAGSGERSSSSYGAYQYQRQQQQSDTLGEGLLPGPIKPYTHSPSGLAEDEEMRKSRTAMSYAFGGVFTFLLYGTQENNTSSQPYTEYLLQCQWGPTLEQTKPWIVARRYREFEALDSSIRAAFPDLQIQLPSLPAKEIFTSSLSPHVIARRTRAFEVYLGHIVMNLPVVLRSQQMDHFLSINDRIGKIRQKLGITPSASVTKRAMEDSLPASIYNLDLRRLTPEAAQGEYEASRPAPLNDRELDDVEAMVRDLSMFLRRIDPKGDFLKNGYLLDLLQKVSEVWPRLKGMTSHMDFENSRQAHLLPRALQCDEDLTRMVLDMRSVIALRYAMKT